MIIFDIHVVRILRLCRNDVATTGQNMADLRLRSHNNNTAHAPSNVLGDAVKLPHSNYSLL